MNIIPFSYYQRVKKRSYIKYALGLIVRLHKWIRFAFIRQVARLRGAKIGDNVVIPFSLAIKANSNLRIENDVIVESSDIDMRGEILICHHCIINKGTRILRVSHEVDSMDYSTKYYPQLIIYPYSWLAYGCRVLPSVTRIERGTIVGAECVLVKNTVEMGIYVGNPSTLLRMRSSVHSELVVPSLVGGDLVYYFNARHTTQV